MKKFIGIAIVIALTILLCTGCEVSNTEIANSLDGNMTRLVYSIGYLDSVTEEELNELIQNSSYFQNSNLTAQAYSGVDSYRNNGYRSSTFNNGLLNSTNTINSSSTNMNCTNNLGANNCDNLCSDCNNCGNTTNGLNTIDSEINTGNATTTELGGLFCENCGTGLNNNINEELTTNNAVDGTLTGTSTTTGSLANSNTSNLLQNTDTTNQPSYSVYVDTSLIATSARDLNQILMQISQKRGVIMLYCTDLRSGNAQLSVDDKNAINEYIAIIKETTSYLNTYANTLSTYMNNVKTIAYTENAQEMVNAKLIRANEILKTRYAKLDTCIDSLDAIIAIMQRTIGMDYANNYTNNSSINNPNTYNDNYYNTNTSQIGTNTNITPQTNSNTTTIDSNTNTNLTDNAPISPAIGTNTDNNIIPPSNTTTTQPNNLLNNKTNNATYNDLPNNISNSINGTTSQTIERFNDSINTSNIPNMPVKNNTIVNYNYSGSNNDSYNQSNSLPYGNKISTNTDGYVTQNEVNSMPNNLTNEQYNNNNLLNNNFTHNCTDCIANNCPCTQNGNLCNNDYTTNNLCDNCVDTNTLATSDTTLNNRAITNTTAEPNNTITNSNNKLDTALILNGGLTKNETNTLSNEIENSQITGIAQDSISQNSPRPASLLSNTVGAKSIAPIKTDDIFMENGLKFVDKKSNDTNILEQTPKTIFEKDTNEEVDNTEKQINKNNEDANQQTFTNEDLIMDTPATPQRIVTKELEPVPYSPIKELGTKLLDPIYYEDATLKLLPFHPKFN